MNKSIIAKSSLTTGIPVPGKSTLVWYVAVKTLYLWVSPACKSLDKGLYDSQVHDSHNLLFYICVAEMLGTLFKL